MNTRVKTPIKDIRQSQVASLRNYAVHNSPTLIETYDCEPFTGSANPLHSSVPRGGSPGVNIVHTHGNDYQRPDVKKIDRVEVAGMGTVTGTGAGTGTGVGTGAGTGTGKGTGAGSGTKTSDSRRGSLNSSGKHPQKTLADLSLLYNSTTASSRAKLYNSIEPYVLHTTTMQNGIPDSSDGEKEKEKEKEKGEMEGGDKDNAIEKTQRAPSVIIPGNTDRNLAGTVNRKGSKSTLPRDFIPDNVVNGAKSVRGGRRESIREIVKVSDNEIVKPEYTEVMKQKEIDSCFEWVKKASELLQQLPPSSSPSPSSSSHGLSVPHSPLPTLLPYTSFGENVHADLNASLQSARDEHIRQITAAAAYMRHQVGRTADNRENSYENLARSISHEGTKAHTHKTISPTNKNRIRSSPKSTDIRDNRDVLSPATIDGIAQLKLKNSAEKKGVKEGVKEVVREEEKEVVKEVVKEEDPDPSRAIQLEAILAFFKNQAEAIPGEPYTRPPFPFTFPSTTSSPLTRETAALPLTPSSLLTTPSTVPLTSPLSAPLFAPLSVPPPALSSDREMRNSYDANDTSHDYLTPTTTPPRHSSPMPHTGSNNLTAPCPSVIPIPRSPATLPLHASSPPLHTSPRHAPSMQRSLTPSPSLIRTSLSGSQLLRTPPRSASPSIPIPVPFPLSTHYDVHGYHRSGSPSSTTSTSTSSIIAAATGAGATGTAAAAALSAINESPRCALKKGQVQSFFKGQRSDSAERDANDQQPIDLVCSCDKFPLTQLVINESLSEAQSKILQATLPPIVSPTECDSHSPPFMLSTTHSPTEYDSHSPPFVLSTTHSPTQSNTHSPPYISSQFATLSPVSSTTHSSIGTPSHRIQVTPPAPAPTLAPVPNLVRPTALSRKSASPGINATGNLESGSSRTSVSPQPTRSTELLKQNTDKKTEIIQRKIEKALKALERNSQKDEKGENVEKVEKVEKAVKVFRAPEPILNQERWSSPMKKMIPKGVTVLSAAEKKKQRMMYSVKAIAEKTSAEKKVEKNTESDKADISNNNNKDANNKDKDKTIQKVRSREFKKSDVWDGNITSSMIIETPEKKPPRELQPYLRRKINPLLKSPSTPTNSNPIIKTPVLERRAFKGGDIEPLVRTPPIETGELLHFERDTSQSPSLTLSRPGWNDDTHVVPLLEPFPFPFPTMKGVRTPPSVSDSGTKSVNNETENEEEKEKGNEKEHNICYPDVYRNVALANYNAHGYNPKINELDVELRLKSTIENDINHVSKSWNETIISADSGSVNLSNFDILSMDDSIFSTLVDSPNTAVSVTCSENTPKQHTRKTHDNKNNTRTENGSSNSNGNDNTNNNGNKNGYIHGNGNNTETENGKNKGKESTIGQGHGNGNEKSFSRSRVVECPTITPHTIQNVPIKKEIGLTLREKMQLKLEECEEKENEKEKEKEKEKDMVDKE